jgi:hypothetical protein
VTCVECLVECDLKCMRAVARPSRVVSHFANSHTSREMRHNRVAWCKAFINAWYNMGVRVTGLDLN